MGLKPDYIELAKLKDRWARMSAKERSEYLDFENFVAYQAPIEGVRIKSHICREIGK